MWYMVAREWGCTHQRNAHHASTICRPCTRSCCTQWQKNGAAHTNAIPIMHPPSETCGEDPGYHQYPELKSAYSLVHVCSCARFFATHYHVHIHACIPQNRLPHVHISTNAHVMHTSTVDENGFVHARTMQNCLPARAKYCYQVEILEKKKSMHRLFFLWIINNIFFLFGIWVW